LILPPVETKSHRNRCLAPLKLSHKIRDILRISGGTGDASYYKWRKRYGGMGKSQLSELKGLEKENAQLKKIIAELELDKLILKESLDFLKPKV